MDQRIITLYDEYTHTPLGRRAFLHRLAALAWDRTLGFFDTHLRT